MRRNVVRGIVGAIGIGVILSPAAAQVAPSGPALDGTIDAETAREMLAAQARDGGWWQASNAAYREQDPQQPDFYAIRHQLAPGGYASVGCMWGNRDGETLGPFWHFQTGWDPVEEALLMYQVTPGGGAAVGHGVKSGDTEEAIQTLRFPGQPATRIRHVTTYPHPDTMVTRSFDEGDGEWVLRRHDVWVWTPAGDAEPVC